MNRRDADDFLLLLRRASGGTPTPTITSSDGEPASLIDNEDGTFDVVIDGDTVGTITQTQINAGGWITVVEPVVGMSGDSVVLTTTGYVIYVGDVFIETDVEVEADAVVVGNALPYDATAYPLETLLVRWSFTTGSSDYQIESTARVNPLEFGSGATDAGNLSTYTFPSMSFGTVRTDRLVVAAVAYRSAGLISVSSVTIGGITATLVDTQAVDDGGNRNYLGLFIASVPTGTSGNVVLTLSGAAVRAGCSTWSFVVPSATAVDTQKATVGTGGVSPSVTMSLPSTSVVVGICSYNAFGLSDITAGSQLRVAGSPTISVAANAPTWTNLTSNYAGTMEASGPPNVLLLTAAWSTT